MKLIYLKIFPLIYFPLQATIYPYHVNSRTATIICFSGLRKISYGVQPIRQGKSPQDHTPFSNKLLDRLDIDRIDWADCGKGHGGIQFLHPVIKANMSRRHPVHHASIWNILFPPCCIFLRPNRLAGTQTLQKCQHNMQKISNCFRVREKSNLIFIKPKNSIKILFFSSRNGTDSNGSELPSIYGEVCVLDTKNRSLGKRKIEAETAKKSFFFIVSFVAFTLPYPFLVTIEMLFNLKYNKTFYEIQYCLNIMSIMSSALNPLVYGLANKQFRNAFRKICHRYYRRYKSRDYL